MMDRDYTIELEKLDILIDIELDRLYNLDLDETSLEYRKESVLLDSLIHSRFRYKYGSTYCPNTPHTNTPYKYWTWVNCDVINELHQLGYKEKNIVNGDREMVVIYTKDKTYEIVPKESGF